MFWLIILHLLFYDVDASAYFGQMITMFDTDDNNVDDDTHTHTQTLIYV